MSEKVFQLINDRDYGFMNYNITLGINIERIWSEDKNEDEFIEEFSELYQHETIHAEIAKIRLNDFVKGEEFVVELMVNGNELPKRVSVRERSSKVLQRKGLHRRKNSRKP